MPTQDALPAARSCRLRRRGLHRTSHDSSIAAVAATGLMLAVSLGGALTARAVEPGGLSIGPRRPAAGLDRRPTEAPTAQRTLPNPDSSNTSNTSYTSNAPNPSNSSTATSATDHADRIDPAADARRAKIDAALVKGIDFLVKSQNKDGSWGTGTETRGFEIVNSVPGSHEGFRAATTALCVMALREVGERDAVRRDTTGDSYGDSNGDARGDSARGDSARQARQYKETHDRGVEFLLLHGDSRRADGMLLYNTWGHIYVTHALSLEIQHCTDEHQKQRLREAVRLQIKRLGQYETYIGGWNYYDFEAQTEQPAMGPTSFGTAAGLVALWEARKAGLQVPQKMIDRALHRLEECRLPNGAYLYGSDYKYVPRLPANKPQGSLGRDQPCNYALWLWNDPKVDESKVREGLEYFFKEHEFIEMGRKRQFPHESWFQTAPYYYYYDHYYAAMLIEKMGPSGKAAFAGRLADVGILPQQDPDGAWWDYAMWDYHKPYGTAFAIMTLLRCR